MKAVAITPGQAHSARLIDVPMPNVQDLPDDRGVRVEVLQVGVDGTDKELHLAEYGKAPEGSDYLIVGHESLGRVVETGDAVTELAPGDFVVATVRRPGKSIYDLIGTYDMTTDDVYYERGISLLHGFTTECYVEEPQYLVRVPAALAPVGVLLEPVSVVEKGIQQAYEIQRRLRVWQPRNTAVMGAGPIGLLAALVLRLRGLEVTSFARTPKPNRNAELLEEIGARYIRLRETSLGEATREVGSFDIIFEATGFSPIAFDSMHALAKNGVLVLSSVTGGERTHQVDTDRINLEFVLGNKVMVGTVNAHRGYFETGVSDFAQAESLYLGWLSKLLTHPVRGIENYAELLRILFEEKTTIKPYLILGEC